MSTKNTQTGHTPSEPLFENTDIDSNIGLLLSNKIVIHSQQPIIQYNTTNMIPSQIPLLPNRIRSIPHPPHVLEHENLTRRQLGQRRRRERQRQRRQAEREQQRQQRESERQQQSQQQIRYQRPRTWSEIRQENAYWESVGFPFYMEENNTPLLEVYDWETMNPNERQEIWEQNHLNELQRNAASEQQNQGDHLEGFAILEHLALIEDEMEQMNLIDILEKMEENEQQHRDQAEQIQLEQWEQDNLPEIAVPEQLEFIQDEMEQLQQIETAQTIEEEKEKQERNNAELDNLQQWEHIQFLLQQFQKPYTYRH